MDTIETVLKRVKDKEVTIQLFGCDKKWYKKFYKKIGEIGKMIAKEQGVEHSNLDKLPLETTLDKKAQKLFDKFCVFIDKG